MIVYRVENKRGEGPYTRRRKVSDWLCDRHVDIEKHPSLVEDGIYEWKRAHKCGFSSLKKLKAWFDKEELKALYEAKFDIVRYEVDKKDVLVGKKQVMFNRRKARRV
jgi:hypothetical protein